MGGAALAINPATSHVRLSASVGHAARPDVPSREQEGRVSGASAEEVVSTSAVVYPATPRAGMDQSSQP